MNMPNVKSDSHVNKLLRLIYMSNFKARFCIKLAHFRE